METPDIHIQMRAFGETVIGCAPGFLPSPEGPPMYLDSTNLQILHRLARQGRTSIAELAQTVGRSESAVRERVAHLEAHGVIAGYGARLDLARLGLGMRATVRARIDPRRVEEVSRRLKSVPEVLEARF